MGTLEYFQKHRIQSLFRQVPVVKVLVINDGEEDTLVPHDILPPGKGFYLNLGERIGASISLGEEGLACIPTFAGKNVSMFFPWRCVLRSEPLSPPASGGTPGRKAA